MSLAEGRRVRIVERVYVRVDPSRDLHGPCVARAANGDLLLCHQDANQHLGGDGFTHQWRSRDNGFTWLDEGPVADWRERGMDSLFGEYGLAPDGRLVMIVQRRQVLASNEGIVGSWLQVSEDHGKSWREIGPLDERHEHAVMSARNILTDDGVMYMGVWSRFGGALYVSRDQGLSWRKEKPVEGVFTGHSLNRHIEQRQPLRLDLLPGSRAPDAQMAVRVSISLVLPQRLCYNVSMKGPHGFSIWQESD